MSAIGSRRKTQRFDRARRLRKRWQFEAAYRQGARFSGPGLKVVVAANSQGPRLGCAISKKVGNAVARNRVRRLLREAFRQRAEALPNVDIIVTVLPGHTFAGLEALKSAFLPLLERTKKLRGRP